MNKKYYWMYNGDDSYSLMDRIKDISLADVEKKGRKWVVKCKGEQNTLATLTDAKITAQKMAGITVQPYKAHKGKV